jgi:hypothetical protein
MGRSLRKSPEVRCARKQQAALGFRLSYSFLPDRRPDEPLEALVCNASRSGTSRVSLILANESRWATRPFLAEEVDAERATAKSN